MSGRSGRAQDEAEETHLLWMQQLPNLQFCYLGEAGTRTLSSLWWIDGDTTRRTGTCLLSRSHRCTTKLRGETSTGWRNQAACNTQERHDKQGQKTAFPGAINERARLDNSQKNHAWDNTREDKEGDCSQDEKYYLAYYYTKKSYYRQQKNHDEKGHHQQAKAVKSSENAVEYLLLVRISRVL